MKDKTLNEVCETFGVSRRAVQGYESIGLVSASGKNERGYLLYDKACQERIRQIKLYQQFGFKLKEIKNIIDAPEHEQKEALKHQIVKMKGEKQQIEDLINRAHDLIETI